MPYITAAMARAKRQNRHSAEPEPSSIVAPSSLPAVITPSNLPAGWRLLDHANHGAMPRYPQHNDSIRGVTGGVPLFMNGEAVWAITATDGSNTQTAEDTTGWDADRWNAEAAVWAALDPNYGGFSCNYDDNENEFKAGYGGWVYQNWGNLITAVASNGDITYGSTSSNSSAVPMVFTIALRYTAPASMRVTGLANNQDDDDYWVWAGFVRRVGKCGATTENRVMSIERYDRELELERGYDLQDVGAEDGRWYRLSYEDEDPSATEAPREAFAAYQCVARYFDPFTALQVSADIKGWLAARADEAVPLRSRHWVQAISGMFLVLAVSIALVLVFVDRGLSAFSAEPVQVFGALAVLGFGALVVWDGLQEKPASV